MKIKQRRIWLIFIPILLGFILCLGLGSFLIGTMGFGPGLADYSYDLPGGYWLVRSSVHEISITPKEGYDPENPPPIIPAKVAEIAFDDRYILAKQYNLTCCAR